jgi:hypothetical protein
MNMIRRLPDGIAQAIDGMIRAAPAATEMQIVLRSEDGHSFVKLSVDLIEARGVASNYFERTTHDCPSANGEERK